MAEVYDPYATGIPDKEKRPSEFVRYPDLKALILKGVEGENINDCRRVERALSLVKVNLLRSPEGPQGNARMKDITELELSIIGRHTRICQDPKAHNFRAFP